jgi:HSP20 family protein
MSKLTKFNDDFFNFSKAFEDIFSIDKNTMYRGITSYPCDVIEGDTSWTICMDVPGMEQGDFTIKFENGTIIIQGERLVKNKTSNNKFTRLERQFGKFSRSFRLPEGVDVEATEASYEKGTLTVILPKKEEVKPKTIEVKMLGK